SDGVTAKKQSGQAPESLQVVDVAQLLLTSVKQPATAANGTGTGPVRETPTQTPAPYPPSREE
ncbi:hypothetical protein TR74_19710, partial [Carbonactinospora thermoautotrophica]